jgi:hypothetical protein
MSKGKQAKTASKNNPKSREQAKEFLFGGKKVKPVQIITESTNFFGAEYEDGSIVKGSNGEILTWRFISSSKSL